MAIASAVIFDLDGTLVDTLDDLTAALNHVLLQQGYPGRTKRECAVFIGDGARVFMQRALPARASRDDRVVDGVLDAFRTYYTAHLIDESHLYDGMAKLLDCLEEAHIPKAIVSNKPDDMTQELVRQLLHRWHWTLVTGDRPDLPRKPDPAGAQLALRELGVDGRQCLFVGDSGIDMATARQASMIPVGVLWGFRERPELEAQGAQHLVSSPAQLGALLGCRPETRESTPPNSPS